MKKVDDYLDNVPNCMRKKNYEDKLKTLVKKKKQGKKADIEGYAPEEVKKELIKKFHNNCAFCECNVSVGHHLDTEHFRPKDKYYWLAYEWSNFLLACRKCNSDCKNTQFPIENQQAALPDVAIHRNYNAFLAACHIRALENEKRLLLHPVLDKPEEHLAFQENGEVLPINDSLKGKTSIEVYGLNDWQDKGTKKAKRPELVRARKQIVEKVRVLVEDAVNRYDIQPNMNVLFYDLKAIHHVLLLGIEEHASFSAVRRACLENFKSFFIDKFKGHRETALQEAYSKVIQYFES